MRGSARGGGARSSRSVAWCGRSLVGAAALVIFAADPSPAIAQAVRGTVRDAERSRPLSGVLVSLLDPDGERVAATLSDDRGRYSLDVGRFGRFRLRAERIGLGTSTSQTFDLFSTRPLERDIVMGQRAIEIEGLVVDSRVEQCRLDRDNAVQIQRWWQEVRTALDVSAVVQTRGLAEFRVERFERRWTSSLSRVVGEARHTELGRSSSPFVSVDAEFLAERGYVQGDAEGSWDYFAPDAEVLLSDVFLARHCFSLVDHDDDALLGLAFEPTRDDVVDISGTLWVDTTTAELQSLEFRYAEQEGVPENESGGFVAFEYLPSGAWIVPEWYIRMPSLARDRRGRLDVVGYVDVGGRATPLEPQVEAPLDPSAIGSISGVVYDNVGERGLGGATVSILGTDLTTVTDDDGGFGFLSVPVGERRLTFSHPEPEAWGLGPPLVSVEVRELRTTETRLEVPSFRRVAAVLCRGSGLQSRAVLAGDVVGADGAGLGQAVVVLTWPGEEDDAPPARRELRPDADGHFVACAIPPETVIRVDVRIDGSLIRGFEISVPEERIAYRRMRLPIGPRARRVPVSSPAGAWWAAASGGASPARRRRRSGSASARPTPARRSAGPRAAYRPGRSPWAPSSQGSPWAGRDTGCCPRGACSCRPPGAAGCSTTGR